MHGPGSGGHGFHLVSTATDRQTNTQRWQVWPQLDAACNDCVEMTVLVKAHVKPAVAPSPRVQKLRKRPATWSRHETSSDQSTALLHGSHVVQHLPSLARLGCCFLQGRRCSTGLSCQCIHASACFMRFSFSFSLFGFLAASAQVVDPA